MACRAAVWQTRRPAEIQAETQFEIQANTNSTSMLPRVAFEYGQT
jgi:hypothetical protein